MSKLITVWTFPYQHQLLIIRGRLESEGIESFTQDETTIQVDPLFSNAIGGIKLLVYEDDVPRAIEILAENGFVKKEDKAAGKFLLRINKFTSTLPVLGDLGPDSRLLILVAFVILVVAGLLYLLAV